MLILDGRCLLIRRKKVFRSYVIRFYTSWVSSIASFLLWYSCYSHISGFTLLSLIIGIRIHKTFFITCFQRWWRWCFSVKATNVTVDEFVVFTVCSGNLYCTHHLRLTIFVGILTICLWMLPKYTPWRIALNAFVQYTIYLLLFGHSCIFCLRLWSIAREILVNLILGFLDDLPWSLLVLRTLKCNRSVETTCDIEFCCDSILVQLMMLFILKKLRFSKTMIFISLVHSCCLIIIGKFLSSSLPWKMSFGI